MCTDVGDVLELSYTVKHLLTLRHADISGVNNSLSGEMGDSEVNLSVRRSKAPLSTTAL